MKRIVHDKTIAIIMTKEEAKELEESMMTVLSESGANAARSYFELEDLLGE